MIPDHVLSDRLKNHSALIQPLEKRTTALNSLYSLLSNGQINEVIHALETGELVANGDLIDLYPYCEQIGEKGDRVGTKTWQEWELNVPKGDNSTDTIHLISSEDERAIINITLKTSDLNRHLRLKGQAGGQKPKMGPKLYAFLAVWYSRSKFVTDPSDLFGILESREDIWGENGVIDGRRGLDAVTEFLDALEYFETEFNNDTIDLHISIASDE